MCICRVNNLAYARSRARACARERTRSAEVELRYTSSRCAPAECKAITGKYRKAPIILKEPGDHGERHRRTLKEGEWTEERGCRKIRPRRERRVDAPAGRIGDFLRCCAVHETSNHVNVTSCNFAEVRVKNCFRISCYLG